MSAPQVMVFLPKGADGEGVMRRLCSELELEVDWQHPLSPYAISAQRRDTDGMVWITLDAEASGIVEDLLAWEKPEPPMKQVLQGCESEITIHYRGQARAARGLQIIASCLGDDLRKCIVENGRGCVLLLADVADRIAADSAWTWEREHFPELPGVASSEWLE